MAHNNYSYEDATGNVVKLSEKSQKSLQEIYAEINNTLEAMLLASPIFGVIMRPIRSTLTELIHWIFDPKGTHPAPSEMIADAATADTTAIQTNDSPSKLDA